MLDYDGLFGHTSSINGGVGTDQINAAAVDSNTTVNLNTGTGSIDYVGITTSGIEDVVTGDGNDSLIGNSVNNNLSGMRGNDTIIGGSGNDTLQGGDGSDVLTGSNPSVYNSGSGEYDNLTGGAGADIFVLGDSYEAYYQDYGFATLTDFDWTEGDKIQVFGSASDYSLQEDTFNGGIDILYQGDLIGYVSNTTDVIISEDLNFV